MKLLKDRLVLITGANQGIGAAIAERFAQEGARLILVAQNLEELEKLDDHLRMYGPECTLVPLDLKKFQCIHEMANSLSQRFGYLDVLIGNAAILGTLMPLAQTPLHLWHQVLDTNLSANWHLIHAFDPLLKRSKAGRGIFVTCSVTQTLSPYWGAYSVSKTALENMVYLYASENIKSSLKINLINPGVVRTALRAKALPGEDISKIAPPESITDAFVYLASEHCTETGKKIKAQGFNL